MSETVTLPYQWSPRPYQQPLWNYLAGGGRRAVTVWPRRHGKDDVYLRHTSCAMGERKGNYWYLLPQYEQARKAMWDAIDEETGLRRIDAVFPPSIRTVYREQSMQIGYGGSLFQLVGADNFHALVGSPPVGLVFSEFARTDPGAWAYLMPILEKNRGWVGFNSTPFGNNHYRKLLDFAKDEQARGEDWFTEVLTADTCGVYSKDQLDKILRQLQAIHGDDYGKSLFLQEYYCSFDAAIPGSIYGDAVTRAEATNRVVDFERDPTRTVYTAWDLGRTDDTAIWWYQFNGDSMDLLDYHGSSLKDIPFYVDLLQAKAKEHGYTYGTHYVPHDARPRTLAAGGKSILQQFQDATRLDPSLGRWVVVKRLDVQEGIQAARKTFPRCRFHKTRTHAGMECLRNYRREWDPETRDYSPNPVHDWSSHGADAFRYLALSWHQAKPKETERAFDPQDLVKAQQARTWGQITKQHFDRKKHARAALN